MSETGGLIAAIRAEPEGAFKLYRATEQQPEVEQAMSNLAELTNRVRHARFSNCLIEVVSLRLQYMDIWLRVYFENTPHTEARQQEFGRLLKQCLQKGLDKSLYDRIQRFNKDRVKAIHGYLLGIMKYDELSVVVAQSDGLSEVLAEFVLLSCGEIVTTEFERQHHNRGDTVRHLPSSIAHLRSREPI
jgi:hypothetical protein